MHTRPRFPDESSRTRTRMRLAAAALALLAAWATPADAELDPARVGWTSVQLSASKFFLSASATVTLATRESARIAPDLLVPPTGTPIAPGPTVVEMRYDAELTGLRTVMTALLDPPTGASIQTVLVDSGRRSRERRWRFTDSGAYHWTRRPVSERQAARPPAEWQDRSEGMRAYPAPLPTSAVTEPAGLVYVLAAAPLQAVGDRAEITAFSRRRLHRVSLEVKGSTKVTVDFREQRAGRVERRRGEIEALKIELRGQPLDDTPGSDDEPFQFLGLSGAIEIALDPVTRLPLQISGNAPYVGRVAFRLRTATLAQARPLP